jgi:hypothetical protein
MGAHSLSNGRLGSNDRLISINGLISDDRPVWHDQEPSAPL